MNEVQLIEKYLKRLTNKNSSSQGLNDDIFFDKSKKLAVSIDTYIEKVHFPNFKAPDFVIKKINFLIGRNKVLQKLAYSKTYMFYSMKMIYYKFGWLLKLIKKYLIR